MSEDKKPSTLVIALIAALVASLAVGGWLLVRERGAQDDLSRADARVAALIAEDDAAQAALDAAKKVLVQITTYSWKDGEHDFGWLDQIANAELKAKLAPNVSGLQKAIVGGKVTAKGQVVDAAPRAVSASQVEVLAFVDQAIANATDKGVKIEEQRVSMTMKLVDGAWLVDRLELLSGNNSDDGGQ
jgi:Mce-associated membrane protein